jgi:hypothetical protein
VHPPGLSNEDNGKREVVTDEADEDSEEWIEFCCEPSKVQYEGNRIICAGEWKENTSVEAQEESSDPHAYDEIGWEAIQSDCSQIFLEEIQVSILL